ncbi:MAG: Holliday junction resolvase RuvX [Cyclobacteriaceae bacterium]|nr:Holliday junction resolvase RuvX [Cyclobacteriaceae bacterium]MCH8516903.1 Holliday junction resolvase RuvX [Cyclobacteriaceae bacterium]
MGRLLAIDYGMKRSGIAVTDPMRIIASPLETVPTQQLMKWLEAYFAAELVDRVVIGMPKTVQNEDSKTASNVKGFMRAFRKQFPQHPIETHDERFTSVMAHQAMIAGGMKKKDRANKENVDKISAAIILQSYMESKNL